MPSKAELILDIVQFAADLIGIADPTGTVDAVNGLGYLVRGKWIDAATSAISLIPYVGDLSKVSKIPKAVQTCLDAMRLAATDAKFMRQLRPALKNLKELALDKIPVDQLPKAAADQIKYLRREIERFLAETAFRLLPRARRFDTATTRKLLEASEGMHSPVTGRVGHAGAEHVSATRGRMMEHAEGGRTLALSSGFIKFDDQVSALKQALNSAAGQRVLANFDGNVGPARQSFTAVIDPLTVRMASPTRTWTMSVTKVRVVLDKSIEGVHVQSVFPLIE